MNDKAMAQKKKTTSQRIALTVLAVDALGTGAVLGLCVLAILRNYSGALPYLTTLIGAMQAVRGVVLSAYFKKSTLENTAGGIVYDTAMQTSAQLEDDTESEGEIV